MNLSNWEKSTYLNLSDSGIQLNEKIPIETTTLWRPVAICMYALCTVKAKETIKERYSTLALNILIWLAMVPAP